MGSYELSKKQVLLTAVTSFESQESHSYIDSVTSKKTSYDLAIVMTVGPHCFIFLGQDFAT